MRDPFSSFHSSVWGHRHLPSWKPRSVSHWALTLLEPRSWVFQSLGLRESEIAFIRTWSWQIVSYNGRNGMHSLPSLMSSDMLSVTSYGKSSLISFKLRNWSSKLFTFRAPRWTTNPSRASADGSWIQVQETHWEGLLRLRSLLEDLIISWTDKQTGSMQGLWNGNRPMW